MEDTVTGVQEQRLRAAAAQLAEVGYAVVPGVVDDAERQNILRLLWDAVESLTSEQATPVKRDQARTHRGAAFLPAMKGIITEPSELSHCAAAWRARKAAAPYFARLHGSPHVLASFDRVNMYPAPGDGVPVTKPKNWLHTDQSALLNGLHSIQGYIDLMGTGPDDAGLIVAPRSHKAHHQLLNGEWGVDTSDNWYKFTDEQFEHIRKRFGLIKVECPPGSLVLWDSRTFHQNEPPRAGGHARRVIYTSFQTRSMVPAKHLQKVLARRVSAFSDLRATSHTALSHFKMFGKRGRTYGNPVRVFHVDREALGVPSLAGDPVVASLVGADSAPAVRWTAQHAPLLAEAPLAPEIMVANRTKLLAHVERTAPKAPLKRKPEHELSDAADAPPRKRSRRDDDDDDSNDGDDGGDSISY